ncbi:thiol-disulfide oxidoreductase DCC family protein [uncultured Roseobacter sp.]|uniref:thiol-disulfide oxidoreductase DCC family protein n=1 Tax=uncultured Roseobacter sp. TaxID=114847 RepID=UPI0026235E3F|nr:DUF393 domain-containing protein [uncultured Roseobacter sp.]
MSETEVLYNADCPVCRREIDHYARLTKAQALPLRYTDLSAAHLQEWGVTADAAARRLHVRKQGEILAGLPAFVALWRALPRYRWLARLVSLPGIYGLANLIYERVLAPLLYRAHRRRIARSGCSTSAEK